MKYVTENKVVDVRYIDCSVEFDDILEQIECEQRKQMA